VLEKIIHHPNLLAQFADSVEIYGQYCRGMLGSDKEAEASGAPLTPISTQQSPLSETPISSSNPAITQLADGQNQEPRRDNSPLFVPQDEELGSGGTHVRSWDMSPITQRTNGGMSLDNLVSRRSGLSSPSHGPSSSESATNSVKKWPDRDLQPSRLRLPGRISERPPLIRVDVVELRKSYSGEIRAS
jgi:hypothetical protein